jgi:HEAT repeat protein
MPTEAIRDAIVLFLLVVAAILSAVVCHIVVLHAIREIAYRRRQRLIAVYRPLVEHALHCDDDAATVRQIAAAPRRHRPILAALVLEPLRLTAGATPDRARTVVTALGLVERWTKELHDRRWWTRAEAARSLGVIRCPDAVSNLIAALEDDYDEVRAAAVEALGLIRDPASIPELIARLGDQSRHQRVRLVHALHQFGLSAVPPLINHALHNPADRAVVAELLGSIGASGALDQLIEWSRDEGPAVRAAAWSAIGTIGVDERAFYHMLRALADDSEQVRAAVAWALGRSGREDAAPYLAPRLKDEWSVAAHTARALRQLGPAGRHELEIAAQEQSELAQQMLWECGAPAMVKS